MKATETFNPHRSGSTTMWDRFNLHHMFTDGNKVVHFETGEMVVTFRFCGRVGPDDYRYYKHRNIIISSTTDSEFSHLLKQNGIGLCRPGDKTPMPASWLQKTIDGSTDAQTLVIDLDHMVAVNMTPLSGAGTGVSTEDPRRNWIDRKPRHIQRVPGVYYPNRESAPEGYGVRVTRPYKMSDDEKAHLNSLTRACKAWWQMSGWAEFVANRPHHETWARLVEASGLRTSRAQFRESLQMVRWSEIKDRAFENLKPTTIYRLIDNGVTVNRAASLHTHLDVVGLT